MPQKIGYLKIIVIRLAALFLRPGAPVSSGYHLAGFDHFVPGWVDAVQCPGCRQPDLIVRVSHTGSPLSCVL